MNENSSQTIKELSEDQKIKNSSELNNDSASQNEEDLSFEKSDIPSADSSSSRTNTDFDNAGFTQEEFASLLGKYDYNFKPGDLVKGTVFALEPKGAMIDIGAKTAAFMPVQEVSINRVEGLNDVLQPSDSRSPAKKCYLNVSQRLTNKDVPIIDPKKEGKSLKDKFMRLMQTKVF